MPQYERFRTSKGKVVRRPALGIIIGTRRDDYAPEFAKLGLTPEKVASAFKQADIGITRPLQEIFSKVEEDPHVQSVLSKRRRAVTSRTLQITPVEKPRPEGKPVVSPLAQKAADYCKSVLFGDGDRDGIDELEDVLYDLTDAIGRGYSVVEIVWEDVNGELLPVKLKHWPARFTQLGDPYARHGERDRIDADQIRILTQKEDIRGEAVEDMPHKWIVHRHKARTEVLAKAALLRAVTWWMMFKHWSVADWGIFCERYGMPVRLGKYPAGGLEPGADDRELAVLEEAVLRLGKDSGAIIPEGCSVDFVETRHQGEGPYERHAKFCNGEISKAVLGNTLTTEVGSTGGNRALGEVHERAEDDMTDADALRLAKTVKRDLLAPLVRFKFGSRTPVPNARFLTEEERAQKELAERDQILVRGIGLEVPKRYFYETYEIPRPEHGEEVVKPPAQKITAEDDLPEDAETQQHADQLEQEADAEELPNSDRAIVRSALRACGVVEARRTLRALADVKKKSRAWAT